ncbi:MAG: folate-binding protein YgfZ [Proteobacteria bacterium]|nr:folate-binding protein YgfZ [Pseudomonadota bacterium]
MTMHTDFYCHLKNRTIIEIHGSDREDFLQGLITQDVRLLKNKHILYSLMLSAQGKFQFDFFIINEDNKWLIDIDTERARAFLQKIQLYKLRSDVAINENTDWQVGVSSTRIDAKNCFLDPRLKDLGYRIYDKKVNATQSGEIYETLLLKLGVPDGAKNMIVDKSIPLEWGMSELQAISWDKGCYMGQELTARSRYVGQIRKRTFPIILQTHGEYEVGAKLQANNQEVGELRATNGNLGIALLKLEALQSDIFINEQPIKVVKPSWMVLPV